MSEFGARAKREVFRRVKAVLYDFMEAYLVRLYVRPATEDKPEELWVAAMPEYCFSSPRDNVCWMQIPDIMTEQEVTSETIDMIARQMAKSIVRHHMEELLQVSKNIARLRAGKISPDDMSWDIPEGLEEIPVDRLGNVVELEKEDRTEEFLGRVAALQIPVDVADLLGYYMIDQDRMHEVLLEIEKKLEYVVLLLGADKANPYACSCADEEEARSELEDFQSRDLTDQEQVFVLWKPHDDMPYEHADISKILY